MRRWSLSYTSQDFALKFMKRGIIDVSAPKPSYRPANPNARHHLRPGGMSAACRKGKTMAD
jgi:hypothetical protein